MRMLVVEDDPTAAAVLAKRLREHAYAVDVAADGSAAVEVDVPLPGSAASR